MESLTGDAVSIWDGLLGGEGAVRTEGGSCKQNGNANETANTF